MNPTHMVAVTDFSAETLRQIIGQLEASTDFEHLVYREAELDAIWTLTGFFLETFPNSSQGNESVQSVYVRKLHEGAHQAHDLVAERCPREAAALLRRFL
jgi:hypothetical protein